ncbi:MAG: ATP-grasp domain-containing protein [Thermodesulfobacteriota bacterium]
MAPDRRVLVVGTTPDYIDWIRRACPQRSVFVTDQDIRRKAREPAPAPDEEVLCDLTDMDRLRQAVTAHLGQWHLTVNGVACFDCESLAPAALLAGYFSLPFPSPEAVSNCRDKSASKRIWLRNGLSAPRVAAVRTADESVAFFRQLGADCVLKPVSGSGSELVFCCRTEADCRQAYAVIEEGLARRSNNRLYSDRSVHSAPVIAEEFIRAPEFSCDFLLENNRARLIRLSEKLPSCTTTAFGTTMGYVLIDSLPGVDRQDLCRNLARAATALGLTRGVCMTDFMVRDGQIFLLEITPRPGGDCLPALIRHALGLDMLTLTLDLAQNRPLELESLPPVRPMAGLRVHAGQGGVLKIVDWKTIAGDPRVKEIFPLRRPGDTIRIPPDDYESFLLGSIIFAPESRQTAPEECRDLLNRLNVEIEPR